MLVDGRSIQAEVAVFLRLLRFGVNPVKISLELVQPRLVVFLPNLAQLNFFKFELVQILVGQLPLLEWFLFY